MTLGPISLPPLPASGTSVTGAGTPPFLAYFVAANQIASTPNAKHTTNDIVFTKGISFKRVETAADYTVLPEDCYVGGTLRLVPIVFTLPLLANVEDGHIFIFADQSGQSPGLPIIPTAQAGEFILEGGVLNASISTFLPGQTYKIIKNPTRYFVLSD